MTLPLIPTSGETVIPTVWRSVRERINGILKFEFDDSRIRTAAEIAALVTPVNFAYEPVYLRRYGGAPGAIDNTSAMDAAESVCAQQGGGTIVLDTPGIWLMNWVCTTSNVRIVGKGGNAEFDGLATPVARYMVAPFSIASAPITFGNGTDSIRYCGLENLHVSGTDGTANADRQSAKSAQHCLRLRGGMIGFSSRNCWYYNGVRTIGLEPTATDPVTGARFIGGGARNDLNDSASARTIYAERLADPGYYTDNVFSNFKINGPQLGYVIELFNNAGPGIVGEFANSYADCTAGKGVFLRGNAALKCLGFTLDPGTTNAVIIETDQAQADPARFIVGELRHGGQRLQFTGTIIDSGTAQSATATTLVLRAAAAFADDELNGYVVKIITAATGAGQSRVITDYVGATDTATVATWDTTPTGTITYEVYRTILFPAEADTFSYKHRIHTPFFVGPIALTTTTDPYDVGAALPFWDTDSANGPITANRSSLSVKTAGQGLRVAEGSNAKQGTATLTAGVVTVSNTSVTANSRIFVQRQTDGGTVGASYSITRTAGTSFTITARDGAGAAQTADTSTLAYEIFEPA